MARSWRVTKFDPAQRDAGGHYRGEDWISIYDIGRIYDGATLTVDAYLRTENAYIETAIGLHRDAGEPPLFARRVEWNGATPSVPGDVIGAEPVDGQAVGAVELPIFVRSCLREILWCSLESEEGAFRIYFGYDYYMYVSGVDLADSTCRRAQAAGMFIEPLRSPHDETS